MRALVMGALVFALGGLTDAFAGSPAETRRRGPDVAERPPEPKEALDPPDADAERDPGARRERRAIEAASAGPATRVDRELHIVVANPRGCPLIGQRRLVDALLALENTSQVMSLEVWGDAPSYAPNQKVTYHARVPRGAWLTLFWIGPDGGIYVPFHNLRIPGRRDVTIDADSIVVPPLGRERWVALATLEPQVDPCSASEPELLAAIARLSAAPHGVGRWEVRSQRPE